MNFPSVIFTCQPGGGSKAGVTAGPRLCVQVLAVDHVSHETFLMKNTRAAIEVCVGFQKPSDVSHETLPKNLGAMFAAVVKKHASGVKGETPSKILLDDEATPNSPGFRLAP